MRTTDQPSAFQPTRRTSQVVYGERQHLRSVLDSIQKFHLKHDQLDREKNALQELIEARTRELNAINRDWDHKMEAARNPHSTADDLAHLAQSAPPDDYLLLRTLAEHPNTPASVLAVLATHPYDAVQENVARHPNTDAQTLEALAAHPERPLWFLVACNQAAPPELRERLRRRMESTAQAGAQS